MSPEETRRQERERQLDELNDPTYSLVPPTRVMTASNDSLTAITGWTLRSHMTDDLSMMARGAQPTYDLVRRIGQGGMGEVWEAIQVSLGRIVAVKRILPRDEPEEDRLARKFEFRQEATIAAHLEHPNIIPVHDLGIDPSGEPLLAMKLVQGTPWHPTIKADAEVMAVEDLLAKHLPILVDVAQAVAFAHSRGIVHRDIKPGQVMVGEFGEVLLTDWGLAIQYERLASDNAVVSLNLATPSTASSPAGTPALMAPEQTRDDASEIGPWTDIYLLGGTLYFLLTGAFPHSAGNARDSVEHARTGMVEAPGSRAPGRAIPPDLEALCMRALALNPRDRPASAKEFLASLQDHLSGNAKRRQSVAVTAEVAARLAKGGASYTDFADALAKIENARVLWPENPEVIKLHGIALEGHARAALANGDLVLARAQAERIPHGPCRAELLNAAEAAEHHARRRSGQRQLAIAASFVLLVAVVITVSLFSMKVSAQRRAADVLRQQAEAREREAVAARQLAEQRLSEAREARGKADGLLRFMIGDLRERLSTTDPQLQLLNDIALRAADYYTSQSLVPTLSTEESEATADGMRAVARLLMQQGRSEARQKVLTRLADFAMERKGDSWRQYAIAAKSALTRLYDDQLKHAEAIAVGREAVALCEDMVARNPGRPQLLSTLTESRGLLIGTLSSAKMYDEARELVESNRLTIEEMERMDPERHDEVLEARITNLLQMASIAERVDDIEAATASYREGIRLREEQLAGETSGSLRALLVVAPRFYLARVLGGAGKPVEAVPLYHKNIWLMKDYMQTDPANSEQQLELAMNYRGLGTVSLQLGDLQGGIEAYRGFLASADAQLEREPSDLGLQSLAIAPRIRLADLEESVGNDEAAIKLMMTNIKALRASPELRQQSRTMLHTSLSTLARLYARRGDEAKARQYSDEAATAVSASGEADPTNDRFRQEHALSKMLRARLFLELGDAKEATAAVDRSVELVSSLPLELNKAQRIVVAAADQVRGEIAALEGDDDGARRLSESALKGFTEDIIPDAKGTMRELYIRALVSVGRVGDAREAARQLLGTGWFTRDFFALCYKLGVALPCGECGGVAKFSGTAKNQAEAPALSAPPPS